MSIASRFTAFVGSRLLAAGAPADVAMAARRAVASDDEGILVFDDDTGRQVDLDLRGTDDEVMRRFADLTASPVEQGQRSPGRPRLGVVSREVTLLPRHWEWLSRDGAGASAAIRKLVEAERRKKGSRRTVFEAQQACDRFMTAVLGNEPGYEEAARALYAGDSRRFRRLTEPWPSDLRDYALRLAAPAFEKEAGPVEAGTSGALLKSQFEIAWALTEFHLNGLSTEECLWRPAPRGLHVAVDKGGHWRADWPEHEGYEIGPPSIAWITWHVCYWWTKALEHLEGRTGVTRDEVAWPGTAEGVRATIAGLRDRWLDWLGRTTVTDLSTPRASSWPVPHSSPATIAAWLNVELTKNAAEIGLIRFLHAVRTEPTAEEKSL